MKKTLIALAVLGAAAGTAYAQSNVTIYGVVDTGYVKKTGSDTTMDENVNSRIGFKGVEDLGDGMKATFQLEKRFDVGTGENNSNSDKDWEGAANVGLKGDDWGWVRLGRMNGIATENIRKFDPFYQYGVGSMIDSTQRAVRTDRTLRYDSPDWAGFSLQASYSLGKNMNSKSRDYAQSEGWKYPGKNYPLVDVNNHSNGYDNDGYALGLNYKNGGWAATANYQVVADSNKSHLWNVGLSYSWDTVKIEALYQDTLDKGIKNGQNSNPKYNSLWQDNGWGDIGSVREQQALLGLEWKVGPGRLNASAQWLGVEGKGELDNIDADAWKVAVGYTYNLSKRTSLYGIVSYTDWDNSFQDVSEGKELKGSAHKHYISEAFGDPAQDSTTAVQIGITHKF